MYGIGDMTTESGRYVFRQKRARGIDSPSGRKGSAMGKNKVADGTDTRCRNRAEFVLRGSNRTAGRMVCGRCATLIDYGNIGCYRLSEMGPGPWGRCETAVKP